MGGFEAILLIIMIVCGIALSTKEERQVMNRRDKMANRKDSGVNYLKEKYGYGKKK